MIVSFLPRKKRVKVETPPPPDVYIWHDQHLHYCTSRFFLPAEADLRPMALALPDELKAAYELVGVRDYKAYIAIQWIWPKDLRMFEHQAVEDTKLHVENLVLRYFGILLEEDRALRIGRLESARDHTDTANRLGVGNLWLLGGA